MAFEIPLTDPNFATELALLGVTGSLSYAEYGTTIPAGMDRYEAPIVNLGWLSDEGLTEAFNEESASFVPWQSTGPIRTATTAQEFTFSATLWSIGGLANALLYGVPQEDMRWDEEGQFVEFEQGGELPPEYKFMLPIDLLDGEKHRRFILPAASVAERPEVAYTKGELTGYAMTFKANLDPKLGYSVLRRFKEGWKPGQVGTTLAGAGKTPSLGKWDIDAASALTVTGTLADGTVDVAYTGSATAAGGTEPYTYALSGGALPAGVSLDASGTLSGTPTVPGESTFTVTATDAAGAKGAETFTITIDPA